jgi:D-3-phosphoglycerate dehydrogenase
VAVEAAQQVVDVLEGRSARHAVNAPLLTPETARAIAPYLPLAETMGSFLAQYVRGGIDGLAVEVSGELADHESSQIAAAALRGLLEDATTERVNLVNAATIAKTRGIAVTETRTSDAGAYATLVTLRATSGDRTTTIAGTIGGGEPRLVRIDDYRLDMEPAPWMLVTSHRDRPGMVGRIGALLGEADVNISAMTLARTAPRADALMLLALDDSVPETTAATIRGLDSIIDVWVLHFDRSGA